MIETGLLKNVYNSQMSTNTGDQTFLYSSPQSAIRPTAPLEVIEVRASP